MRLVVFGGRDYSDQRTFDHFMAGAVRAGLSVVIEGGAPGADRMARKYAEKHGIPFEEYAADWDNIDRPGAIIRRRRDGSLYDAGAGFLRNQQMLDEGKPDMGLSFPGGNGTADMLTRCDAAGLKVIEVPRGHQPSL